MKRRISHVLVVGGWIALTLALGGCDLVSKQVAQNKLMGKRPRHVLPVLDFRYTENRGMAFSLERVLPHAATGAVALGLRLCVALFLVWFWIRTRAARWPFHLACALLAAGAVGNLAERLFRGYVIDFIHVPGWPVFNLADVFITAGTVLLLFALAGHPGDETRCRTGPEKKRPAAAPPDSTGRSGGKWGTRDCLFGPAPYAPALALARSSHHHGSPR